MNSVTAVLKPHKIIETYIIWLLALMSDINNTRFCADFQRLFSRCQVTFVEHLNEMYRFMPIRNPHKIIQSYMLSLPSVNSTIRFCADFQRLFSRCQVVFFQHLNKMYRFMPVKNPHKIIQTYVLWLLSVNNTIRFCADFQRLFSRCHDDFFQHLNEMYRFMPVKNTHKIIQSYMLWLPSVNRTIRFCADFQRLFARC